MKFFSKSFITLTILSCTIMIVSHSNADSNVIFDGFKPSSLRVGPSPSNQENSNDPARYFQVYLPDGYGLPVNAKKRYPVVYFLHGFGLNYSCYGGVFTQLDQLIKTNKVQPLILVKVDGSLSNGFLGSFYTNSALNGNFEDYITQELRTYINGHYRTKTAKSATTIAGHAMGAFGALVLAIKHPDIYSKVIAHSPPSIVAINPLATQSAFYENVLQEIPECGDNAGKLLPMNGPYSYQLFSWAAALSPNSTQLTFQVDLPVIVDANFVPVLTNGHLTPDMPVLERWKKNDPFTLLPSNISLLQGLEMYIDMGDNEQLIDTEGAQRLHSKLNRLGIAHTFVTYSGSSFPQPYFLTPYSPSNDIPLRLVFPVLQKLTNFIEPDASISPQILVDLVIRALQTDYNTFNAISLTNFGAFINFCGLTLPDTIGELLINEDFRTCLSNNGIDPDQFVDGYFEITQLMNIDPGFFRIDTDGFAGNNFKLLGMLQR